MPRRNPSSSAASRKWTKKFVFLSPHVGRPGKAFLDHNSVSKLYPWAKTNIKCSNRTKLACERPPLCHTAASNITSSAIADQDSLPHRVDIHVACMLRAPHQDTVVVPSCTIVLAFTVVLSCAVALAFSVHDLHTPH